MNSRHFNLFQASLFNSNVLETEEFVISRQVPMLLADYHSSLFDCTKQLTFLTKTIGLNKRCIVEHQIGFCDRTLSHVLPHHKSQKGIKLRGGFQRLGLYTENGHESMRGCFTLPIKDDEHNTIGVYGLRYDRPRRTSVSFNCCTFTEVSMFAPALDGEVALMLKTPFDVLAFAEAGYRNGFAVLGETLNDTVLKGLRRQGISSVVVFTDATTEGDFADECVINAVKVGIRLCSVPLPFRATHLGKWDDCQWRLLESRLARFLSEIGVRNERYQA